MKESILNIKAMRFAIRIVNLYKFLSQENKEYIISKQLLRSGTSVGALVREGEHAESKHDFIHKYAIAQKECNESLYWLELLHKTNYLTEEEYKSVNNDADELMKIITSSIKTAKKSISKN